MSRTPSLLLRVTRALVGLVTVWCLGCAGYEPILDSLRGSVASAGMDCGSASMQTKASTGEVSDATAATEGPSISACTSEGSFDCGCGSWCHAVSYSHHAIAATPLNVLERLHHLPAEHASVSRVPLLPPPQRAV